MNETLPPHHYYRQIINLYHRLLTRLVIILLSRMRFDLQNSKAGPSLDDRRAWDTVRNYGWQSGTQGEYKKRRTKAWQNTEEGGERHKTYRQCPESRPRESWLAAQVPLPHPLYPSLEHQLQLKCWLVPERGRSNTKKKKKTMRRYKSRNLQLSQSLPF